MDTASTPELRGASIRPAEVEREYQNRFLHEDGRSAAVMVVVLTVIMSVVIRSDWQFIDDAELLRTIYLTRVAFVVLTAFVAWAAWTATRPAVMHLAVLGWTIGVAILSVRVGSTRPPDYYVTVGADLVVVMVFWAALPNRFVLQALSGLIATAASLTVLSLYRLPLRPEAVRLLLAGFLGINLLGAFLSWRAHRSRRTLFLEQRSLIAAEEAIRKTSLRLALAMEGGQFGAWDWIVGEPTTTVNRRWREIVGVEGSGDESTCDNQAWMAAIHPDDASRVIEGARALVDGRLDRYDFEYRLAAPDGSWKWVRSRAMAAVRSPEGKARRVAGTLVDITARKVEEQRLRLSEERLREAQRISHVGNWDLDLRTTVLTWSDEVYRIFEIDRKVFGASYDAFLATIHPDDRAAVNAAYTRSVDSRTPYEITHRLRMPDGRVKYVQENCETFYGPGGKPIRSVGTVQDVTEQRRVEAQLRLSQKLESIGRLAGGVAHDFNNLLSVILSTAEETRDALARGQPADPECIDDLLGAGRRAAALTQQLLRFARQERAEPEVMDLGAAVRGSRKLLERLIGDDVRIEEDHRPGLWKVRCDPSLVGQVVMNLMLNARDAMPGGGTLTLSTENVALGPGEDPPAADLAPGDYVRLTVRDTGHGMTPEVMEHLFEPFFTTKGPDHGTGLGLATVYGIVKQGGGSVAVRSAPGEGATFEVYFPRAPEPAATASSAEPSAA